MTHRQNDIYHRLLRRRIDEVLCYIWDPIGVSSDGTPETRNEYESYVDSVVSLVVQDASKEQIADLLKRIQKVQMGMRFRKKHCEKVAEIILNWDEFLQDEYGGETLVATSSSST